METHEAPWDGDKIVAAAVKKYGSVHVVIHNTGLQAPKPSDGFWSSTAWSSSYEAVLKGAFKVSTASPPVARNWILMSCSRLLKQHGLSFAKIAMEELSSKAQTARVHGLANLVQDSKLDIGAAS